MKDIKAVIFDCDGLMFDTESYGIRIWKEECEKANIQIPEDFFKRITGSSGEKTKQYIQDCGLGPVHAIASKRRFDLDYLGNVPKDSLNMKGLIEIFLYLKEEGYKVAIASSSSSHYVETLLKTVSVPLPYDGIVGGDSVKDAKPNPEIFLLAAKMIGESPQNCLVLEDSKSGILAAKAAGMHSIFIEDTIHPDEEMNKAIDLQASDLLEVITLLKESKVKSI